MVSTLVLEEEFFGNQVAGKGDGGDAEAGEGALEAVETSEGACVPPMFTIIE
jgi:hypothetical protein